MTILLTVTALDARPVLRLGTLTSLVALIIAVAATEDFRLGAVARHMTDLLAVVTFASTTTSTRRVLRFGAVGLVVAVVGQYLSLVKV
jgi:hypothetical protein